MSDEHTPGGEQESPAGREPGSGAPPPDPGQAGFAALRPGWDAGQQASSGYGRPGYGRPGYVPPGPPPPTYTAWGIIASICGVLFNVILGLPAARIGNRYARKVPGLWTSGDAHGAVIASRKARNWLIASAALDAIGLLLLIVVITQPSGPRSNFSNPSVVAASIQTQLNQRLSDPNNPVSVLGVTVTSVVCTRSGPHTDHCAVTFSNGATGTETAVISGNGTHYAAHGTVNLI
jgi:Interferon-induced transmembrane protein